MTTVFVIVDVQHKILSVMSEPEKTTNALVQLTTGMQLLNIPTILNLFKLFTFFYYIFKLT